MKDKCWTVLFICMKEFCVFAQVLNYFEGIQREARAQVTRKTNRKRDLGLTDVLSASQHAKLFLCIVLPVILKKGIKRYRLSYVSCFLKI